MLRKIIAVVAGVLAVNASHNTFILFWGLVYGIDWLEFILLSSLPFTIGGIAAGLIVSQKGWFFGLLASIIHLGIWNLTAIFSSDIAVVEQPLLTAIILEYAALLLCGSIGGHLGQLLAQKWHKKST